MPESKNRRRKGRRKGTRVPSERGNVVDMSEYTPKFPLTATERKKMNQQEKLKGYQTNLQRVEDMIENDRNEYLRRFINLATNISLAIVQGDPSQEVQVAIDKGREAALSIASTEPQFYKELLEQYKDAPFLLDAKEGLEAEIKTLQEKLSEVPLKADAEDFVNLAEQAIESIEDDE